MTREREDSRLSPTLREMTSHDLTEICALERLIFADPWPESAIGEVIVDNKWGGLVAELDGRIIGYACFRVIDGEAHLANLAVDPAYRRKSVAKQLLDRILQQVSDNNCGLILLEVRQSNEAARRFYEKAGFAELYRKPSYYKEPAEDAVVMMRWLKTTLDDE